MGKKLKKFLFSVLKNIVMLSILGGFLLFLFYIVSDHRSLDNNPQLLEKIAVDEAKVLLDNKKLFSEYEQCKPVNDDSLFEKKLKTYSSVHGNGLKFKLHSTAYMVKVSNSKQLNSNSVIRIGVPSGFVSCEARVLSGKSLYGYGKWKSGLVFLEDISNEYTLDGVMLNVSPMYSGYLILIIAGIILFIIIWGSLYFHLFRE